MKFIVNTTTAATNSTNSNPDLEIVINCTIINRTHFLHLLRSLRPRASEWMNQTLVSSSCFHWNSICAFTVIGMSVKDRGPFEVVLVMTTAPSRPSAARRLTQTPLFALKVHGASVNWLFLLHGQAPGHPSALGGPLEVQRCVSVMFAPRGRLWFPTRPETLSSSASRLLSFPHSSLIWTSSELSPIEMPTMRGAAGGNKWEQDKCVEVPLQGLSQCPVGLCVPAQKTELADFFSSSLWNSSWISYFLTTSLWILANADLSFGVTSYSSGPC